MEAKEIVLLGAPQVPAVFWQDVVGLRLWRDRAAVLELPVLSGFPGSACLALLSYTDLAHAVFRVPLQVRSPGLFFLQT